MNTQHQTKWQHYRYAFFCPDTGYQSIAPCFMLKPETPDFALESILAHLAKQLLAGNIRSRKVDLSNITIIITPYKDQPKYNEP
jgi:hypothetical protein